MRILIILSFTLSILLFYACGRDETGDGENKAGTASADGSISGRDRDSLRLLYHQLMAARKDSLPLRPIYEKGKIYPVDEAPKDTAFFVFREQLLNAIDRRDLFSLMDVIHPEIKVDFGGASGVADFVSAWGLDDPEKAKNSNVWDILGNVLQQGGTFQDGGKVFIAPYVYASWPDAYDPFEYAVITGSGVRLRSAPGLNSQTLTMVSYDLVERLETTSVEETIGGETYPWEKIKLPGEDGVEGYIFGKFVASSIDFRAAFERQDSGRWLMTFLVAGD